MNSRMTHQTLCEHLGIPEFESNILKRMPLYAGMLTLIKIETNHGMLTMGGGVVCRHCRFGLDLFDEYNPEHDDLKVKCRRCGATSTIA